MLAYCNRFVISRHYPLVKYIGYCSQEEGVMDDKALIQARERLLRAGWKLSEINRLCRFLKAYVQTSLDQADLDIRHLEFIRWLVLTGRLVG